MATNRSHRQAPHPEPALEDLLLALHLAPGMSRAEICRLARGAPLWAFRDLGSGVAGTAETLGVAASALARARALERTATDLARPERERVARLGARLVFTTDPAYPIGLFDLELPPPVLTMLGVVPPSPSIAVVGARAADDHGLAVARWLAAPLAQAGIVVVSGMAPGIDRAAHQAALAAGGTTVAWLGCGVDVDYPRGSARLKQAIAAQGAVLAELPLGTPPRKENFPIRNRLIAAHAAACVVVQARARSGSLITARLALDLGREVLAVPNRLFDPRGEGPNRLLRDGARPALDASDLLAALPAEARSGVVLAEREPLAPGAGADSPLARRLLRALVGAGRSAQGRGSTTGAPLPAILEELLLLEMDGRISRCAGARYRLVPRPG